MSINQKSYIISKNFCPRLKHTGIVYAFDSTYMHVVCIIMRANDHFIPIKLGGNMLWFNAAAAVWPGAF